MSMIGLLVPIAPLELQRLKRAPSSISEHFDRPDVTNLQKMWQALHFLLSGRAWDGSPPLGNAVLGGAPIGPDRGYGPARYLTPDEVQAVDAALQKMSHAELRRRFQPSALANNDIYPMVWDEPEEDLFDELRHYFDRLVACYGEAARNGNAMLLCLT